MLQLNLGRTAIVLVFPGGTRYIDIDGLRMHSCTHALHKHRAACGACRAVSRQALYGGYEGFSCAAQTYFGVAAAARATIVGAGQFLQPDQGLRIARFMLEQLDTADTKRVSSVACPPAAA